MLTTYSGFHPSGFDSLGFIYFFVGVWLLLGFLGFDITTDPCSSFSVFVCLLLVKTLVLLGTLGLTSFVYCVEFYLLKNLCLLY